MNERRAEAASALPSSGRVVNFFKHHLGDYDGATAHISWDEDMAYTRLLRVYYRREKPIPADREEAFRLVRAKGKNQRLSVARMLEEFFILEADGWHNKRADEEIAAYQAQASHNRIVGNLGGRPKQTTVVPPNNHSGSFRKPNDNPNHEPLTTNQEPVPKNQEPERSRSTTFTPATAVASAGGEKMSAKSGPAWESYAHAYRSRYSVDPVRNAQVNAKLAQLVDRLGEEAPLVAEFYLTLNNPFYVKSRHPVGLLLQEAEGIRTQWATGVKATGLEGRSAEQKDAVREQIIRVSARLENNETH